MYRIVDRRHHSRFFNYPPVAAVRRRLRRVALQRRVSALSTIAVALAVTIVGLAGYAVLRYTLYRAIDLDLVQIGRSLAVPVTQDIRTLGGLTERALRAGNIAAAAVRNDGTVFYVPGDRVHVEIGPEEVAVAKLQTVVSSRNGVASDGRAYRIIAVPMTDLGNYAMVVARPLTMTGSILNSLVVTLLFAGTLGVVLAAAAGATVGRASLQPVRMLSEVVDSIRGTDDLVPIEIPGHDDLARLAHAFNETLSSLASSRVRQRRLIADASHELRTPLTSLRTNVELLTADARTGMLKPDDRRAILRDINAQLEEFTTLIGDLVQLARDESLAPAPEPIDFRTVVNAAIDRVRRRGPGLTFDVELNPLYVMGEADSLERAVTNLLDNAVKWSPPGGVIRVHLEGDRLRVADQGPGIDEKDLPFVFDRFYRADTARNTPGTGLGLSIVAETVERHGGWVRAGRSAQGGAEFTIALPAIHPQKRGGPRRTRARQPQASSADA
jgi:two-component system sensor histidine kinase MprB